MQTSFQPNDVITPVDSITLKVTIDGREMWREFSRVYFRVLSVAVSGRVKVQAISVLDIFATLTPEEASLFKLARRAGAGALGLANRYPTPNARDGVLVLTSTQEVAERLVEVAHDSGLRDDKATLHAWSILEGVWYYSETDGWVTLKNHLTRNAANVFTAQQIVLISARYPENWLAEVKGDLWREWSDLDAAFANNFDEGTNTISVVFGGKRYRLTASAE